MNLLKKLHSWFEPSFVNSLKVFSASKPNFCSFSCWMSNAVGVDFSASPERISHLRGIMFPFFKTAILEYVVPKSMATTTWINCIGKNCFVNPNKTWNYTNYFQTYSKHFCILLIRVYHGAFHKTSMQHFS